MKDPGYQVMKAYRSALNGNISYNSSNVPVLSRVPNNQTAPYIFISDQTSATDLTGWSKDFHAHDTTILLDIVTEFPADKTGSPKPAQEIGNQILQLVGEGLSIDADFKNVIVSLDSINTLNEISDTEFVHRRLIRLRNQIVEI